MHRLVAIWFPLLVASCGALSTLPGGLGGRPQAPHVSVSGVVLASAPTNSALARALCPRVANALVCRALGSPPSARQLEFVFDVTLAVANHSAIALPAVEAMVAFTAYPDRASSANVGAVCVALCPEGQACGPPSADGCGSADGGLETMRDYAAATVGFLTEVALGSRSVSDVRVRMIPAGQTISVQVRLALNPDAMLRLIREVAGDALSAVMSGRTPTFDVPYSLRGTLWVDVESFGKIAAGFGPYANTWRLR